MVKVTSVRFKKAGKIYYFDPAGFDPKKGQHVIVETARGLEYGEVMEDVKAVGKDKVVSPLKKVLRIATDEDTKRYQDNMKNKDRAMAICQEKINKHKLDMNLIDVEYTFDKTKIIFYFAADGRVDFRELVKDLAGVFKMRIELRQIGVRDEAKMIGGIGTCGKGLCCHTWLSDFEPVSIKMAKIQGLSLNPAKISGICGRLMCCLKYENDVYVQMKKHMPEVGDRVRVGGQYAQVVETNILKQTVKVKYIGKDDDDRSNDEYFTVTKKEIEKIERRRDNRKKEEEITEDIKELLD
ncbi:MAG: stage 0 sporulation family protein [Firmicutes bacterium]|nr:stage 0 sporulation family protein [Bacillota bacterium]MBR2576252.1 stage 0 sporulation family protein [Bacillota bacterium]